MARALLEVTISNMINSIPFTSRSHLTTSSLAKGAEALGTVQLLARVKYASYEHNSLGINTMAHASLNRSLYLAI